MVPRKSVRSRGAGRGQAAFQSAVTRKQVKKRLLTSSISLGTGHFPGRHGGGAVEEAPCPRVAVAEDPEQDADFDGAKLP